ncbi:MAG: thiosulfate oxidation carrier protein SoxY [Hyphomicrobiaceae bacterium]
MTGGHVRIGVRRRDVIVGASAGAAILALMRSLPASAQDPAKTPAALKEFDAAFKQIVGEGKPVPGKLKLEIPEIAENGNTVPYLITVESPMTENDHIKAMHMLSTSNPQPGVASFTLTPLMGKASIASRMRLAKTQDVVALAEVSDGQFLVARRTVKVTIGGCGG